MWSVRFTNTQILFGKNSGIIGQFYAERFENYDRHSFIRIVKV